MNFTYLGYNIVKTDYKKFFIYLNQCSKQYKRSKISILFDVFICFLKYEIRFIDYFYLGFFKPDKVNREEHVSSWKLYKFHKKYNSNNSIILKDKIKFHYIFDKYCSYGFFVINKDNLAKCENWIRENAFSKIVCKDPLGTVGIGVEIYDVKINENKIFIDNIEFKPKAIQLLRDGLILFEEYLVQHPVINEIVPYSVNTIRIVTFLNKNSEVEIWAAILRMAFDKKVDNFDAGGISAMIDISTGIVIKPGVKKDPFDDNHYYNHPITKSQIYDVKIPFWNDVCEMIISAAKQLEDVRTVGWDVVITKNGPVIIEGNDNWDKTHFELSTEVGLNTLISKGLKYEL